jgi:hypothetical protein
MKYLIYTEYLGWPMYFCEHTGDGFTISTDPTRAKVIRTKQWAEIDAEKFQLASGMPTKVKRVKK